MAKKKETNVAEKLEAIMDDKQKAPDPVENFIAGEIRRNEQESAGLADRIKKTEREISLMLGQLRQYHIDHARLLELMKARLNEEQPKS
jgi:hypothetical protein